MNRPISRTGKDTGPTTPLTTWEALEIKIQRVVKAKEMWWGLQEGGFFCFGIRVVGRPASELVPPELPGRVCGQGDVRLTRFWAVLPLGVTWGADGACSAVIAPCLLWRKSRGLDGFTPWALAWLWLQDTALQGLLSWVFIRQLGPDSVNAWAMVWHDVDELDQTHVTDLGVRRFTRLASRLCLNFLELPGLILLPLQMVRTQAKKKDLAYLLTKTG